MTRPLILITNDDGIDSPGLAALLPALDSLAELLVVAPRVQQTSVGRSRSSKGENDGRLYRREIRVGERVWPAFAANGTPAMTVEHGLQELAQRKPDLLISGINFGENVGACVTVSGTIGAALEAAEHAIPAIAVSLELESTEYFDFEQDVDFSVAAYFVRFFAERILGKTLPFDVDVLKIDVPQKATKETAWMVTRQDRLAYYRPTVMPRKDPFEGPVEFDHVQQKGKYTADDTDAYALAHGLVSLTPLSLDLSSRVRLEEVSRLLGKEEEGENN